ncbi:MBOAT family O-acyltransferase [Terracidiphilus gabretensis]|uniref:MBOAT family O-acyltransferase n=1 Tax=Terracidiphilus gabretensis TaxID=1577687 RepID=UPI0018D229C7|nr:MBOAT family O-acyltransferase [Terracidiphilus gabretensis]
MALEHGWARLMVWSILAIVFAYVWLKKYTFLPEQSFLHFPYFTLGLSYIFFRVLHLLIESGDGVEKRHVGFGVYLLYTLNFTTFVSGPIQRYDDFVRDQLTNEPPPLNAAIVGLQLERLVRGFFKVNVLAMFLQAYQQDAILQMGEMMPLNLKLYAAARLFALYPLFLYCNFSGYIDLVIAIARLMRITLPENFNRSFSAACVIDFWSQWHMTLSSWFKSYVYNPLLLALMRRISSLTIEPFLGVFCFFVTFFLVGIWHGRTSQFVIYGLLTGLGVSVNKLWQVALTQAMGRKSYKNLAKNPAYRAFGRGLNFSWFAFTLIWFWGDSKEIHGIFAALSPALWLGVWAAIWLSATILLALWEITRAALLSLKTSDGPMLTSRYARVVYASALGLAALFFTALLSQPAPGIVYKAF